MIVDRDGRVRDAGSVHGERGPDTGHRGERLGIPARGSVRGLAGGRVIESELGLRSIYLTGAAITVAGVLVAYYSLGERSQTCHVRIVPVDGLLPATPALRRIVMLVHEGAKPDRLGRSAAGVPGQRVA